MELPTSLYESMIRRGIILHSDIFEDIDHGKFFAVIGVSGDMVAGFFFINSRIHPTIIKRPAQFAMQYPLKKSDYSFLKYDSFLSATVIQKIPVNKLSSSIKNGQTTQVGNLTDDDLTAVLDACRKSELFRPSDKKKFFY